MRRFAIVLSLVVLTTSLACFAQKDRKYIVLKRAPAVQNAPFSEAVRVGDTIYVAGHIGIDPATGKPGATPEQEARLVMDAIQRTV